MGATVTHLQGTARRFALSGDGTSGSSHLGAVLIAAAGAWLLAVIPLFHTMWTTWMTDPLRSIGMFFPVLSLALLARVWRNLGWECSGSWWGLVPLLLALAAIWMCMTHSLAWRVGDDFSVNLLPEGPILSLALSAGVLMIGGIRVWKTALFPLMLLLVVNPVPSAFNALLDLPLQHASAETARRFALLIGEHPDGAQLRLMFTPDFGMFIAPGCNGIRGAVTLGYVALIASYWRGFSIPVRVFAGLCGVATGYLFNFLRLCLLVVYYKVGRFVPVIQPHGALIDYLIGGSLFLSASVGFGLFFFRPNAPATGPQSALVLSPARARFWPAVTFVVVTMMLGISNLYAVARDAREAHLFDAKSETVLELPQRVGAYSLVARWNQGNEYLWGRYSNGNAAEDVSLGLWLEQSYHDALLCHLIVGEKTVIGEPIVHIEDGAPVAYRTFSYEDSLNNVYAASRLCAGCDHLSKPAYWFGPVQWIQRPPEAYFKNPSATGVLILHEADLSGAFASAGYAPLRSFIAGLHEGGLIQVRTK